MAPLVVTRGDFCAQGESEVIKALFHVGLISIASICAAYNFVAWQRRREPHLALNSGVYAALVGYELRQIARHLRAPEAGL